MQHFSTAQALSSHPHRECTTPAHYTCTAGSVMQRLVPGISLGTQCISKSKRTVTRKVQHWRTSSPKGNLSPRQGYGKFYTIRQMLCALGSEMLWKDEKSEQALCYGQDCGGTFLHTPLSIACFIIVNFFHLFAPHFPQCAALWDLQQGYVHLFEDPGKSWGPGHMLCSQRAFQLMQHNIRKPKWKQSTLVSMLLLCSC